MDEQSIGTAKYVHTRANELYQELYALVMQSRPGTPLASENALAHKYHVSRMTARKVLSRLESEELIERRHGIGSIVKGKRVVSFLLPCPEYLEESYQPLNDILLTNFRGAMKAAMTFNLRMGTVPVAPVNNPDFNLYNIDYEQLSDIGSDSLIVCSAYFCKLYQYFLSKHAKVAIISAQYEHYGYRHFHNDFYTVDADKSAAMNQILNYCYGKGKRRIAVVKGDVAEKKYPLNRTYTQWCARHSLPELFYSFPDENFLSETFAERRIADLYEQTHFDALVFQHVGFRNVSGTIQEVLGLPPEIPVFGVDFNWTYAPNLAVFPCCNANAFKLGYEAVKILYDAPKQGTIRTFPYEFHTLPSDWEACLKEYQNHYHPNNFHQPQPKGE